jgi:hypothetical protein
MEDKIMDLIQSFKIIFIELGSQMVTADFSRYINESSKKVVND